MVSPTHMSEHPEASSWSKPNLVSDLNMGQCDIIDGTIKQVTHKLYQTILTPDVGTINSECALNTATSKASIMTRVSNSWTLNVTNITKQDSTTACQLPKHSSLHPPSTNPYKIVAHKKLP